MKEDRKGGYFGQLEGGTGTDSYYDGKGLIGAFKDKRQFAAIGLASNTGATGFTASGSDGNEAVALSLDAGVDDGLSASAGTGVPRADGGGAHFSNKWDNGKEHVTGNYSYGHQLSFPLTFSITEQLLPDTIYMQNQTNRSVNASSDHGFTGAYDLTPDTLSAIHIALSAHSIASDNQFSGSTSTVLNGVLADKESQTVTSKVTNEVFSGSLYLERKLSARGRQLTFTADIGTANDNSSGYVIANGYFAQSTDTLNQRKAFLSTGYSLEGTLNYTEPVAPASAITFTYAASVNQGRALLETYNEVDGHYTALVDSLSGNFKPEIASQRGTVNFQTKTAKYTLTGGLDAVWTNLQEANLLNNSNLVHSYTFFTPHVFGHYIFNNSHIIYFSYNSSQQYPALSQLQPLQNNTDPLHISSGNPQLQPLNNHSFGMRYLSARPSIINIGAQGTFLTNDISSRTSTDSLGRQLTKPVNINGNWNIYSYLSLNPKLSPSAIEFGLNLDLGYGRKNTYVNNSLSRNDSYQTNARLSLGRTFSEKYQVQISSDIAYNYTQSSINQATTPAYWLQIHTLRINLQLPGHLQWNSNIMLTIFQKTPGFTGSNKTAIWDTYLNRDFFAGKLSIKLKGNNLLGQHTNISRTIAGNETAQNITNNVTGRYLLVYVIYHFSKRRTP